MCRRYLWLKFRDQEQNLSLKRLHWAQNYVFRHLHTNLASAKACGRFFVSKWWKSEVLGAFYYLNWNYITWGYQLLTTSNSLSLPFFFFLFFLFILKIPSKMIGKPIFELGYYLHRSVGDWFKLIREYAVQMPFNRKSPDLLCHGWSWRPQSVDLLYASTRVMFHFILRHSRHLFVVPVMFPSFLSLLRHRRLFVLLTVHYRLLSSPRLSSFVYSFVTDLFRPFYVPSIISRICGYAIIV